MRFLEERDRRYAERFEAQEKAVGAALASAEKAVDKAERSNERRFEVANEFRGQLADQAATFMPRAEADLRLSTLERSANANAGRSAGWVQLLAAVVALAAVAAVVVAVLK